MDKSVPTGFQHEGVFLPNHHKTYGEMFPPHMVVAMQPHDAMTPTLQEDTALMPGHAKFYVFHSSHGL